MCNISLELKYLTLSLIDRVALLLSWNVLPTTNPVLGGVASI